MRRPEGFATAQIFVVSPIIVLRISHDSLLHVQPTTEPTAVLHNWFDCSVMEPKAGQSRSMRRKKCMRGWHRVNNYALIV